MELIAPSTGGEWHAGFEQSSSEPPAGRQLVVVMITDGSPADDRQLDLVVPKPAASTREHMSFVMTCSFRRSNRATTGAKPHLDNRLDQQPTDAAEPGTSTLILC